MHKLTQCNLRLWRLLKICGLGFFLDSAADAFKGRAEHVRKPWRLIANRCARLRECVSEERLYALAARCIICLLRHPCHDLTSCRHEHAIGTPARWSG